MKSWVKILMVIVSVLLPVVAQSEPLEQPCPVGQTWDCDTYPGTEAACGCKKGGPRVYSVASAVGTEGEIGTGSCPYGLPGIYDIQSEEGDDIGQWWHGDECSPADQWWCNWLDEIHNRDYCHNGDGQYDITCWNLHENSPKQDQTNCDSSQTPKPYPGTGYDRLSWCNNTATVLCPGLRQPGSSSDWLTFECHSDGNSANGTNATGASGILDIDAQGHPTKGVECAGTSGIKRCGCHVTSAVSSSFVGSMSNIGLNRYRCN